MELEMNSYFNLITNKSHTMKHLINNSIGYILICLVINTVSNAQFTCGTLSSNNNTTNSYSGPNSVICGAFENYAIDPNYPDHTPERTIFLNFHYMVNDQGSDPMSFTETTGFNNNDNVNNGFTYANELIAQLNFQVNNNLHLNLPCGNSIPVLPTRLKFEIFQDPNVPNGNGIYFHHFNNVFIGTTPNNNSGFWYQHWLSMPTPPYPPVYAKNQYSVFGDKVIDIFFTESNNPLIDYGGYASEYGDPLTPSLLVADMFQSNFGDPANKSWRLTTDAATIIHEIGHILNLLHIQGSDNCTDTQDGTSGGCFALPPCNLFTNNIMDYCGGYRGLSPCQINTIQYFIESENPKFIKCHCDATQNINIPNGDNIIWNSSKHLSSNIIIEPGASLTIKCDVFMPTNSVIKVREGGLLIIDGGRITKSCDRMWAGIMVLGSPWLPQNSQGKVIMTNGGVIEFATKGIMLNDYYMNGDWPEPNGNHGGGVVQITNSTIRNCRKGVEFWPYHRIVNGVEYDNLSSFDNCTFVNDEYLPGYNYPYSWELSPEFCTAWDVQGVRFQNCTFKDELSTTYNPEIGFRSSAIFALSSRIIVTGCHFSNLFNGVGIEALLDPADYVEIYNNSFTNVFRGITSTNQIADKIAGNNMTAIPSSDYIYSNINPWNLYRAWGMYMVGSTKFSIYDNNVESANPVGMITETTNGTLISSSSNNFGIDVSNSFLQPSSVRENTIKNVTLGLQTEDNNMQYQMSCNSLTDHAFGIHVNPVGIGLLADQGSVGPQLHASNAFNFNCSTTVNSKHLRTKSTSFAYFDYHDVPGRPYLACTTPSLISLSTFSSPQAPNCNLFTPPTTSGGGGSSFTSSHYPSIDEVSLDGLTSLQKQTLLFNVLERHSQLNEIDNMARTLRTINSVEAYKYLTALYYSTDELQKASDCIYKLQTDSLDRDEIIPLSGGQYPAATIQEDTRDFIDIYSTLVSAKRSNRTIRNFNASEIAIIESVCTHDTRSAIMARRLLHFSINRPDDLEPEVPVNAGNKIAPASSEEDKSQLNVFPNPFENTISIVATFGKEDKALVKITDVIGNIIQTKYLQSSNVYEKINTQSYSKGIYLVTLYINNQKTKTFKVMKN